MNFSLDPRIEADTLPVTEFALSRVLLMNDARYPWLVLVPRRADLIEIVDLTRDERLTLMDEIARVSEVMRAEPGVEKINVAALGNIVRQLHVHVLGRRAGDPAWPGPVWGAGPAARYTDEAARALAARWKAKL